MRFLPAPSFLFFQKTIVFLFLFLILGKSEVFAQGNCSACNGTGQCQYCNGDGISGYGNCHGVQKAFGCEKCNNPGQRGGECSGGYAGDGKCSTCNGTGSVAGSSSTNVQIAIPIKTEEDKKAKAEAAAKKKKEDEEKFKKKNQTTVSKLKSSSPAPTNKEPEKDISANGKLPEIKDLKSPEDKNKDQQFSKFKKDIDLLVPDLTISQLERMKIEREVLEIRKNQHQDETFLWWGDCLVDGFDLISTIPGNPVLVFKGCFIFGKSVITRLNEAEVIIIRQTGLYEKTLKILKDPIEGPKLNSLIKTIREKKPLDEIADPELLRLAYAITSPELGNSELHTTLSASFSKEANAAVLKLMVVESGKLISERVIGHYGEQFSEKFPDIVTLSDKADEAAKLMAANKRNVIDMAYLSEEIEYINKKVIARAGEKFPVAGFDAIWEYKMFPKKEENDHH